MSRRPPVTEPLRVRIEDRNGDGRGRARRDGRTVLVSQAHPGEEVLVRIDRVTAGTVQGRVREILERDARRIPHACRHEFFCTGCAFLAETPEAEAAFKTAGLAAVLGAVPGVDPAVLEPLRTPVGPFGWRALAKLVFHRRKGRLVLGAHVAGTHLVADTSGCPVLEPGLTALLDDLRRRLAVERFPVHAADRGVEGLRYLVARWSRLHGRAQVVFVTSEEGAERSAALAERLTRDHPAVAAAAVVENRGPGNALLEGPVRRLFGEDLEEELLGHRHRIGPTSFFQVNPRAAEVLFAVAREMAGSGPAVFEGYAGIGALTLPLAERFEEVVAVERQPEAARGLRAAADRARGGRVTVIEGETAPDLERFLRERPEAPVVLDPPRSGLGEAVCGPLARAGRGPVVLLSCDPSRAPRDLGPLVASGYRLRRVVPVDQFPRTAHVESVSLLERE